MIARKSFLMFTSQIFTRFLGWIGLFLLAKLWGDFAPEALGTVGFAMAFLALFNIFTDLGFSTAHVKRISEGKDLGTCLGTFTSLKIVLTSVMVFIFLIVFFVWKNVFGGIISDATTESVIFIFLVYYIFYSLRNISVFTFRGKTEIAKSEITHILEGIFKLCIIIPVAFAGVSISNVNIPPVVVWPEVLQPLQQFIASHIIGSLAIAYVAGVVASFLAGVWFLRKYPWKRPNWNLFKSYFSFAFPTMLLSTIGIISLNIDKIMIGYFWTSVEVGYYFTIQQIIQILLILSMAVATILFPTLSKYHSKKDYKKINETSKLAERYVSMIIIPPLVVLIIFVYPIINILLSSAYIPAASILITLTIYALILSLIRPYSSLIIGINRPDISAKIGLLICGTNIVLNMLFIPKWGLLSTFGVNGATGAAVATSISSLIGFFGLRIMAKRLTGIKLLQIHTPKHIIAGFLMALVLYVLNQQVHIIRWYHLGGFALFGLGIYLGVLWLLKEFKKEDLLFFLDIIHPKEMSKYIRSEIKK